MLLMNVFEKSKLHADRRELSTKKATLHFSILKLCSFKYFQSCNCKKDQNGFYKGIDENSIKRTEHIIQLLSDALYIQAPQTRKKYPSLPLNCSQDPFSINYLTHKPFHLTFSIIFAA